MATDRSDGVSRTGRGANGQFAAGNRLARGRLPGIKQKLTFDMRTLRKRMLSVFDEIGGEKRLAQWAEEHYDRFILEVCIPLHLRGVR